MISDNSNYLVNILKNKKWEEFGYFSEEKSVIFDGEGKACYRYDSGWLVSYDEKSICRVDSKGNIVNINNQIIARIENYSKMIKDFDRVNYKDYSQISDLVFPIFKDSSDYLIRDYWNNAFNDSVKAESIVNEAYNSNPNYPEYVVLYATHLYLVFDAYAGKYGQLCDADEYTLELLYDIYNFCNQHLFVDQYGDTIKKIMDLTCYLIGEYYTTHGDMVKAERILNSVNEEMFPYKSVLMGMIISHNMNKEYESTGNLSAHWEEKVLEEINLLKKTLVSDYWSNPYQKSIALTYIQGYTCGIYFGISEINYSYNCLLFARDLKGADLSSIDSELRKYKKSIFGKLTYRI